VAARLPSIATDAAQAIDQSAAQAVANEDEQAQAAVGVVEATVADVASRLDGVPDEASGEAIDDFQSNGEAEIEAGRAGAETAAADVVGGFGEAAERARADIGGEVAKVTAGTAAAAEGFASQAAESATGAAGPMQQAASGAIKSMGDSVGEAVKAMQTAVRDAGSKWSQAAADGAREMAERTDKALAGFDEPIRKLGAEIDREAGKLRVEATSMTAAMLPGVTLVLGLLSMVGTAIKHIVIGFVKGALEFLGAIFSWAGLATLVFLVVILVAAFFFLTPAGFVLLLKGIVLLGILAAVLTAGYYVWKAITDDQLTWEERWEYVGRALFEAVMALFAGRILGGISKLFGKLGGFLARWGGSGAIKLAKIVELIKAAGGLVRFLRFLRAFRSLAKVEAALIKFGNDGARLEAALAAFYDDAVRLETTLGAFADDVARLEAALKAFSGSGTRVEAIVRKFGGDATKMEAFLKRVGGKGADLEDAMRAAGDDVARLDRILTACKDDVATVLRLRKLTSNAAQLDSFLAQIDDAVELERLIKRAGLDGATPDAGRLERVLAKMPPGKKAPVDVEKAIDAQNKIDNKILTGELNAKGKIIGAHSPRILSHPDFRISPPGPTVNADGTLQVKFRKVLNPGPPPVLAPEKGSTLAPRSWSDADILKAGDDIAKTPAVQRRAHDGATLHEGTVNGVDWVVIKDAAGNVTSSFPTGGNPFTL
jgi:hypothetical protein